MDRRKFLQLASLATAGSFLSESAFAKPPVYQDKIVVLVHLRGANDGFNSLVHYDDSAYQNLRPKIALKERTLIKLNDTVGMHPQLKQLESLWKDGNMAWVEGVGYPQGILSHFKSLEVWESASRQDVNYGWLARVLPDYKKGLHGIVLDKSVNHARVLAGSQVNAITMQNPKSFLKSLEKLEDIKPVSFNPAIAHVTHLQHQTYEIGRQIAEKVGSNPRSVGGHFTGDLGHNLESVAQMIVSGVDSPVYKVTQTGFDTHSGQITAQSNSLFQLANGISSFAKVMKQAKLWDKVVVVTYSEFGRRIKENKGAGTDHGTASAHMVFGGNVKGGLYGKHPDLSKLDENDNVQHTTDFRAIYGTLAQRWWGQKHPWQDHGVLPFV